MSINAQQVVASLLEDGGDSESMKAFLMRQDPDDIPARQIWGDFGDPWVYGGAWIQHGRPHTVWLTRGLEGEGIKDVEPWDIKVPPEIEAGFVQQVLPETPYRTLKEVENVEDPDDPGDYLYRDEAHEIDQLIDEWTTDEAQKKNDAVKLPVYRFDDDVEDWMNMDEVGAQFEQGSFDNASNAYKVIEWGQFNGFDELDHDPYWYTKQELKNVLSLRDL